MERGFWKLVNMILLGLTSQLIFEQGHTIENRLSSFLTFRNSEPMYTCTSEGFYGNEENCSIFHRCVEVRGRSENDSEIFKRYDFECPLGTIFDTNIDNCNHPWTAKPTGGCSGLTNNTSSHELTNTTTQRPRPQSPSKLKQIRLYNVKQRACLQKIGNCERQKIYGCNFLAKNEIWYLIIIGVTKDGRLRVIFTDEKGELCLEAGHDGNVYFDYCRGSGQCNKGGYREWILGKVQTIVHEKVGGCLYIKNDYNSFAKISKDHCDEKWEFSYSICNSTNVRIESGGGFSCVSRQGYGPIPLFGCDHTSDLKWTVVKIGVANGKDRVKFSNISQNFCIEADAKSCVLLSRCKDIASQVWLLGKDKSIVHEESGECLIHGRENTLTTSKGRCDAKLNLKPYRQCPGQDGMSG